jgi:hypothetical protein
MHIAAFGCFLETGRHGKIGVVKTDEKRREV